MRNFGAGSALAMPQGKKVNRRRFLTGAAGAAVGAMGLPHIVSSSVLGAGGSVAAGSRIAVGCIGVGNQARMVMRNFLGRREARVAAVCDVKSRELAFTRDMVDRHYGARGCAAYGDFRELLAREDIDAVLIATPDHWHVLIALPAAGLFACFCPNRGVEA